jgi:hypothetical protein
MLEELDCVLEQRLPAGGDQSETDEAVVGREPELGRRQVMSESSSSSGGMEHVGGQLVEGPDASFQLSNSSAPLIIHLLFQFQNLPKHLARKDFASSVILLVLTHNEQLGRTQSEMETTTWNDKRHTTYRAK